MQSTRQESDADLIDSRISYSKFPTSLQPFVIYCENCNGSFYVDQNVYESALSPNERGLDDHFACDDCQAESSDLEYAFAR